MRKVLLTLAALALTACCSQAVAGETGVPNRLAVAKVGEWASYNVPNGYIQKLTVVKREGEGSEALVTVRVDNIYDGQLVNSTEFTRDAGEPFEQPRVEMGPGVKVDIDTERKTVKGKSIEVTVVEIEYDYDDDEDEDIEWHVSAEIPVFGILKRVENDETVFELVDFGES